jgi:hypothetical protein
MDPKNAEKRRRIASKGLRGVAEGCFVGPVCEWASAPPDNRARDQKLGVSVRQLAGGGFSVNGNFYSCCTLSAYRINQNPM